MSATTRTHQRLLAAAAGLLIGALGQASCTQPPIACTTGHGVYAAKYILKTGDAASPCGQLVGDYLGMQTYYAEKNGLPDFTRISIAIRPESIGALVQERIDRGAAVSLKAANAVGDFVDDLPASDDFCTADELAASDVKLPYVAEEIIPDDPDTEEDESDVLPELPATELRLEWSDLRFYVTANAQGTQFTARLKYTEDGCTATYDVVGAFPGVPCETQADCDDPNNGLNPDFALECDAGIGACIPKGDLPAFK